MSEPWYKKLAQDVLTLEINTIIKEDMLAIKLPSSRRQALWELASMYNDKLKKLEVREPVKWHFAGINSFRELRDRAKTGMEKLKLDLEIVPVEEQQYIRENIIMLERIYEQSSQIVDMFRSLEKNIISEREGKDEATIATEGYAEILQDAKPEISKASHKWNNDIDRHTMNTIDDLDLEPDQLSLIRKAWEIGTQKIVLQTVIEIDGDVTTYISKNFKDNFDNKVMKVHNDSITISTSFWSSLVKTISEMVGETFKTIIGK